MRIFSSFRRKMATTLASLALGIGALALGATPALANHISTAAATTTCTSNTIVLNAAQLTTGTSYTISYTITLKPTSGASTVITGSVPFKASSSTFTDTITQQLNLVTDNYTLTGSASLVGHNTVSISFSPSTLGCACPD